ncbi:MAG: DsbA family protein [bacterium]|nr:DsbA family protein [bacterium]
MQIPFYFDYACPWAYLGSCRAEAFFGELGATIEFRPVHLATLREPTAGPQQAPTGERRGAWYMDDLQGWSEMIGGELNLAPKELVGRSTRLALCGAFVAAEAGKLREYHYPAYRARWVEARDLSDPEVVHALLAGAGLDADAALTRASSPELEAQLDQATQEAIDRGVFGVPTYFVGDRMFWGNDRFELARFYLERALEEAA